MKIVLWPTFSLPNIGGLEVMTHSLAKQLQKEGHGVILISDYVNSKQFQEFTIDGVKTYTFPFTATLMSKDLALMKTIITRARRLLDAFSPDIVNVHGWFECMSFFQTRILEKMSLPLSITVHGLLEQEHYRTPSCLRLWSMARAVNTVSRTLDDALRAGGFEKHLMRVIYNGLPRNEAPPIPLKASPPKLLMVGRLSVEKCFETGFFALARLRVKYPGIKLVLVGGGDKGRELAELKSRLGLDDHIEMTGPVSPDRVPAHIDAATLVLVPSSYESFGLVALEAALRERPVVASGVCGLREVVEHEKTGLLVEPRDSQALADAVEDLLEDPERMQAMGLAARLRAERLFSIENATMSYLDLYESIRGGSLCCP
jgi:glycogen(starch) synthase